MTRQRWVHGCAWAVAGAAVLALVSDGSALVRAWQADASKILEPASPMTIVSWWDLTRTIVTLVAVVALAFMTVRSKAASIYKDELDAQRVRSDRLIAENKTLESDVGRLRQQIEILASKTDLTAVVASMHTQTESQAKFNSLLSDTIRGMVATSDSRYERSMDYLREMMTALVAAQANNTKHIDLVLELVREIQHQVETNAQLAASAAKTSAESAAAMAGKMGEKTND